MGTEPTPVSAAGATLPLAGITVVSIEQAVAAPFATRQLADRGARVVKVERPGAGDFARAYDDRVKGTSSYFAWCNRSKESLALDLKSTRAPEILDRALTDADVFVQNLAPGAASRLGLGATDLMARHPRLIVCDLSGYGSSGPYVDKKAYDLLVQCEAALLSVTGTDDQPAKAGISVADIAGGMYAFSAILLALFHRERSGSGTAIEVSLFDALVEWMSHPMYFTMYSGDPPRRTGSSHATVFPYGSFRTGDGASVQFGIQNDREWIRFCEDVMARPDLSRDERFANNELRSENRVALTVLIEDAFSTRTAAAVIASLDEAHIANARQNDVAGLLAHPQLAERDRWRKVGSPGGMIAALRPPALMHGLGERFDPIPDVGEHTQAILQRLGYADDEIESLRAEGVI